MLTPTYGAPRHVGFGALMSLATANLVFMWRQLLAYVVGVVLLAFVLPLAGEEVGGLVGLAAYFAAQYWLFHTLLKARGLLDTARMHGFAFVGLAAMLIFPILLGLGLVFLPGLFLVARWIAAPAFIVARGDNPVAAASASWQAVRGHTGMMVGAITLAVIGISLVGGALGALIREAGGAMELAGFDGTTNPIDVIEAHFIPLVLFALSTAAYELLGPEDNSIEEVFG